MIDVLPMKKQDQPLHKAKLFESESLTHALK